MLDHLAALTAAGRAILRNDGRHLCPKPAERVPVNRGGRRFRGDRPRHAVRLYCS